MARKTNNSKNNVILKLLIFVSILAVCLCTPVLFATFFVVTNVKLDMDVAQISDTSENLTYSISTLTNSAFSGPGDEKEISTTIHNSSSNENLRYVYRLSLDAENSNGLENAVFVYVNDVFMGTLTQLCNVANDYQFEIDTNSYVLSDETLTGADSFKFVLHNAADGSYYDGEDLVAGTNDYFEDANFKVNIDCCFKTIDYQKVIFVSDETEFKKAIDDVNLSNIEKTIKFTDDITLTDDYEISKACTIDLFGNSLSFSGGTITVVDGEDEEDFIVTFDDTRRQNSAGTGTGITLDSTYGAINVTHDASSYSEDIVVVECNEEIAANLVKQDIETVLKYGIQSGNSTGVPVLESLGFYVTNSIVSILTDGKSVYTDFKVYQPESLERTVNSSMLIGAGDYNSVIVVKVIGDNEDDQTDSLVNQIINEDLIHLVNYSDHLGIDDIYFNMFLPTSVKRFNATISWWSSDESLMTTSGVVDETAQGNVAMVATIKVNNKIYTHTFNFYVCKQSEEMLFQYLLATIGTINLTAVYSEPNPAEGSFHYLPIVNEESMYDYRVMYTSGNDIRLEELTYGPIESTYYYISLGYEDIETLLEEDEYQVPFVYLNQTTFQVFAQIPITGRFRGDKDGDGIPNDEDPDYEPQYGFIGVRIFLGEDQELQDRVFNYIQSYIDSHSVLQNILNTRQTDGIKNESGDFSAITNYMGFTITYEVPSSYLGNTYRVVDDYNFEFNPENFPNSDTQAPVQVTIAFNGLNPDYDPNDPNSSQYMTITATRNLAITIPGAVHINSSGFNDTRTFYSIKMQVLQQLLEPATLDGENYIDGDTTYQDIVDTGEYILRYDMSNCKTLKLEYGTSNDIIYDDVDEEKYLQLVSWATMVDWASGTENAGERADDVVDDMPTGYEWLTSDGQSTISDAESVALAKFCERFDNITYNWENYVYVEDNVLSDEEISTLKALMLDKGYNALIEWATGTSRRTAQSALQSAGLSTTDINSYLSSANRSKYSDSLSTISEDEQTVILDYCQKRGYSSFSTVWRGQVDNTTSAGYKNYCINLNIVDNQLTTNDKTALDLFVQTDIDIEGVNSILTWARSTSTMTFTFNGIDYVNEQQDITTGGWWSSTTERLEDYVSDNELYLIKAYLVSKGLYTLTETYPNNNNTGYYSGGIDSYFGTAKSTGVFGGGTSYRILEETDPDSSKTSTGTGAIIKMVRNARADATLTKLYTWATSTSTNNNNRNLSSSTNAGNVFNNTPYANMQNDRLATISESEQEVILYYAENLATSTYLKYKDNENVQLLINWATSTTNNNTRANAEVGNIIPTSNSNRYNRRSNGSTWINNEEWVSIYYYFVTNRNNFTQKEHEIVGFADAWSQYVNLGVWDNKLSSDDLNALIEAVQEHSDISEFQDIIDWMRGFGEENAGINAVDVTDRIETNATVKSDGLATITQGEYDVIVEYFNRRRSLDTATKNACINYLATCLSLDVCDRVLSNEDQAMILEGVRNSRLHGDFYLLVSWAEGNKIIPAHFKVPSLVQEFGEIESDGTSTITADELSVLIEWCRDNGYYRLAIELETNGYDEDVVPELVRYYYITVPTLNNRVEALQYFDELRRLVVIGTEDDNIFTNTVSGGRTTQNGDLFFETIYGHLSNLYRLDLRYCNVSSISGIENLTRLTHIDLRGNELIDELSYLIGLNQGNIQYINVFGTAINFYYSECTVANLYFEYKNAHSNTIDINLPSYIYENAGNSITYTPANGLTEKDLTAMAYCFLLKEISIMDSYYIQLPTKVYVLENGVEKSYEVLWESVSGDVGVLDFGNGNIVIENVIAFDDRVSSSIGVVSATVTVDNGNSIGTYTRYFNIIITNPNF